MKNFLESATFEHQFWLQVLGDHSRFIRDSLYPSEKNDIQTAEDFVYTFDLQLNRVKVLAADNVIAFTKEVDYTTDQLKEFKLSLIQRHLTGNIGLHLSPSFMNHMVNELEEYQLVINYLKQGEAPPVFHELHHHLLWLLDASGHAGAINDELDKVEDRLKDKSKTFTDHFDAFYLKAVEMTGFLRANVQSFPALQKFNNDVEVELQLFRNFLGEIEEMELSHQVLSTFSVLMADHMAREECYYLMKLAESTGTHPPGCNPAKRRREN
ncbi:DUF2935 domain-containing protein [Virgibacillus xinjiangensis]|uniref:DUF2935 domain-containing protein n=1 Tax=Virgibacillus xinjiangensis TaxID=393090 RepID=A0ABV7CXI5_9BACI